VNNNKQMLLVDSMVQDLQEEVKVEAVEEEAQWQD